MRCRIREAEWVDAPGMAAIDRQLSSSPWGPNQFEGACDQTNSPSERALVADGGAGLWGIVVYSVVLEEGSLHNIAVQPERQGHGVGGALLAAALADMKMRNACRCLLEVRASNLSARGLYQSRDFRVDGVRENYYPLPEGREDALLMSRQL